ncbi:MAG: dihydroorotate dehydrogenase [Candidatus Bathyarchaeota archaeon]|nr:dihydroorotate dehydrogenase [Candidatus Bathyarchaeota archaeon]MDH5635247.1 dihydroorotate dehydrogenase [Candidatus Bathyarchaeota archaeon]MDH5701462.1 dihydroorotate dehydrogenase [Candidatus Bathyarchaeota archaeon]
MSRRLATEIAGLKLANPTMLAAGVLGLTGSSLRKVVEAGAGAVVTKSLGLKPREGYSNPTVVQVDCGLLNAMGLPNPGVSHFGEEMREVKETGVPIIVSIYGFSSEEFAKAAEVAVNVGADALELNVSCPHVEETGAEIGSDPELVTEVVRKVKNKVDKPVFVKLTPNVANIVEVAKAAVETGAEAITAINTVRAMAIEIETTRPLLANKIGGLSGPAIKPIAVRCVYEIYREVDVPVIGCGGITDWRDAVEFMLAGASAVQIGTAIAFKGLEVFKSVTRGIDAYVRKKGFGSVKDIVGLAQNF